MKILIYGYGNPGRQDDGLGPKLVELFEKEKNMNVDMQSIDLDSNYQLNIEDADNIKDYDLIIFADASKTCKEPLEINEIYPSNEIQFTTHSISPQSVLAICDDIHDKQPKAFLLEIRGYDWEMLIESMSQKAEDNLLIAYDELKKFIKDTLKKVHG